MKYLVRFITRKDYCVWRVTNDPDIKNRYIVHKTIRKMGHGWIVNIGSIWFYPKRNIDMEICKTLEDVEKTIFTMALKG